MHNGDGGHDTPISLFFTTYYVITGIVMLNVVVAGEDRHLFAIGCGCFVWERQRGILYCPEDFPRKEKQGGGREREREGESF